MRDGEHLELLDAAVEDERRAAGAEDGVAADLLGWLGGERLAAYVAEVGDAGDADVWCRRHFGMFRGGKMGRE